MGDVQLIGSRTRDFPICSIVPQPHRYRVPAQFSVATPYTIHIILNKIRITFAMPLSAFARSLLRAFSVGLPIGACAL
jgi:hypothetical protein